MRLFVRYTVVGGSAAIVLWILMFGLILIRTITSPARLLAEAASQIATGSSAASVPARGNADAFGVIARAFDNWIDTLVHLDRQRQELDRTRTRLEQTVAEIEDLRARPAAPPAAANEDLPDLADHADEDARRRHAGLDAVLAGETVDPVRAQRRPGGPISTVSDQLQHFSQYVSAAANDVERTEALIKGLTDANRQLDDMADQTADMRDQVNMLAFRGGTGGTPAASPRDDENLVVLTGGAAGGGDDAQSAERLDSMRDTMRRMEQTVEGVRTALDGVTTVAQDIATTASTQALEATQKLLTQSEYLQNMLDDIIAKVRPAERGRLSAPDGDDDLIQPDRKPDRRS